MKQLLFLLLFPCLALAQYQGNGNQKITLGEQTTADGLVFRGVANDTNIITPFSDTSAYIILDTIDSKFYHYNRTTTYWALAGGGGGSTLDTATMLLPYYRAGRNDIIQAADVPTLNQNTIGSAATLTTGRTIQTNLALTSAATFNGSANITPGVTGVLPLANGGTGQTTLAAAEIITGSGTNNRFTIFNGSTTITNSNIYRQSVGGEDYMGINVSDPSNYSYLVIGGNGGGQYALVKGTKMFGYFASEANAGTGSSDTTLSIGNFVRGADISIFTRPAVSGGATNKLYIKNNGNVGIGTASPTEKLHVSGNGLFTGSVSLGTPLTGGNGGTGLTTFGAAGNIPFASSTTVLKTNSRFYIQESGTIPILRVDGNIRLSNAGQFQFFNLNDNYAFSFSVASNSRIWLLQNNNGSDVFIARGPERSLGIRYNFADSAQVTEALSVNGNARITAMNGINDIGASATGVLQAATSDMNLKNTIENSPFGLNEILLLNPVTFLYNDENRKIDSDVKEVGFIAQDVYDVIPNAVSSTGTGDLQLDYRAITASLVKAIKEQNLLIKALEQRILILENK